MEAYLKQDDNPVPDAKKWSFNAAGRAYPDISGISSNYLVMMGNELMPESGTSASTPLLAAMVAHWNDIRLRNNQPPLGFLNPLLYKLGEVHPDAFNDVVIGNNNCAHDGTCCEHGFGAARGWDSVTGLGTPKFDVIAELLTTQYVMGAGSILLSQVRRGGSPSISLMATLSLFGGGLLAFGAFFAMRKHRAPKTASSLTEDLIPQ